MKWDAFAGIYTEWFNYFCTDYPAAALLLSRFNASSFSKIS